MSWVKPQTSWQSLSRRNLSVHLAVRIRFLSILLRDHNADTLTPKAPSVQLVQAK